MIQSFLTALTLASSLEIGWLPNNEWMFWNYNSKEMWYEVSNKTIFTGLNSMLEIPIKKINSKLSIGGSVRTNALLPDKESNVGGFVPTKNIYGFSIDYCFNDFVDLKYNWKCMHPIMPYVLLNDKLDYRFEGGYQELSIKFNGKFKPFK